MAIVKEQFLWANGNLGERGYHLLSRMLVVLPANGWTIRGSNDGTTAAFDGVNRITTLASFDGGANRWVVLRDPSGTWEMMFNRSSASSGTLCVTYNPDASQPFTGGTTTTLPTAPLASPNCGRTSDLFGSNAVGIARSTIIVETAAPYGFAAILSFSGTTTVIGMFAAVPLTQQPKYPGRAIAFYFGGGNVGSVQAGMLWGTQGGSQATGNTFASLLAQVPANPLAAATAVSAVVHFTCTSTTNPPTSGTTALTAVLTPNADNEDELFPIMYVRSPTRYVGVANSFARQTAVGRNNFDCLGPSRERIVIGHTAFKWDGSVPTL